MEEKKKKRERKPLSAMDRALNYLGYRMRSQKEMRDYLVQKGYEREEIETVLSRLCDYGYLDDNAFCKEYLRSRMARGAVGRKKITYDLLQKGIDREIIEEALCEYTGEAEAEDCCALAQKLAETRGRDQKALASIQRTLASRGFGYEIIRTAIHSIREEEWD